MIEFLNVLIALIAGLIGGAALHSAYLHSKKRGSIGKMPWNHKEAEKD